MVVTIALSIEDWSVKSVKSIRLQPNFYNHISYKADMRLALGVIPHGKLQRCLLQRRIGHGG